MPEAATGLDCAVGEELGLEAVGDGVDEGVGVALGVTAAVVALDRGRDGRVDADSDGCGELVQVAWALGAVDGVVVVVAGNAATTCATASSTRVASAALSWPADRACATAAFKARRSARAAA